MILAEAELVGAPSRETKLRTNERDREPQLEVETLRQLRRVAGKAQVDIAAALKIKQPSVSKIERQPDMYLSTLRSYVEAIGGQLELVVRLPNRPALHLRHLGELLRTPSSRRTPVRTQI
jgi:hypothetical protein